MGTPIQGIMPPDGNIHAVTGEWRRWGVPWEEEMQNLSFCRNLVRYSDCSILMSPSDVIKITSEEIILFCKHFMDLKSQQILKY